MATQVIEQQKFDRIMEETEEESKHDNLPDTQEHVDDSMNVSEE